MTVLRRDLRSVATGQALGGAVVLDDAGAYRFELGGDRYLRPLIEQVGAAEAARNVFDDGASNGYWYFAEAVAA